MHLNYSNKLETTNRFAHTVRSGLGGDRLGGEDLDLGRRDRRDHDGTKMSLAWTYSEY